MRYAVLIYDRAGLLESLTAAQQAELRDRYMALADGPAVEASACLYPAESAKTVAVRDGESLTTDGPFADTKEVFGGLYVVQADDVGEAIRFAARVPAARMGGSVEVRPLVADRPADPATAGSAVPSGRRRSSWG